MASGTKLNCERNRRAGRRCVSRNITDVRTPEVLPEGLIDPCRQRPGLDRVRNGSSVRRGVDPDEAPEAARHQHNTICRSHQVQEVDVAGQVGRVQPGEAVAVVAKDGDALRLPLPALSNGRELQSTSQLQRVRSHLARKGSRT